MMFLISIKVAQGFIKMYVVQFITNKTIYYNLLNDRKHLFLQFFTIESIKKNLKFNISWLNNLMFIAK